MSDTAPRPTANDEWENLLRQWRTQPGAQTQPFFYSRVRARLVAEVIAERQSLHIWLRWPSYAVVLTMILLLSGDGTGPRAGESRSPSQQLLYSPAE